jgi:hypothetical protein
MHSWRLVWFCWGHGSGGKVLDCDVQIPELPATTNHIISHFGLKDPGVSIEKGLKESERNRQSRFFFLFEDH